jgi:hypothetical protein
MAVLGVSCALCAGTDLAVLGVVIVFSSDLPPLPLWLGQRLACLMGKHTGLSLPSPQHLASAAPITNCKTEKSGRNCEAGREH